ncbi:MAG: YicC/YloC family endoribonuclease [Bryobacteraceae bacterium]
MPTPLRSMTGFARSRRPLGEGELIVSVKSVNHRGLDVHVHAPSAADPFENAVRGLVKSRLTRGHVEVRIVLPASGASRNPPVLNRALLAEYFTAFRAAAAEHRVDTRPDLNIAFQIPGMFIEAEVAEPEAESGKVLLDALEEALGELNAFREREGAAIGEEMLGHNREVTARADEMQSIRVGAAAAFQARLTERLKDLLQGVQIDPQRLAQEAAVLADRSDIGEELARLKIHSGQLDAILRGGGEVGKKLDFLLQEMNRETNTILSKTSGAGDAGLKITEKALATKAAIEKIREQSLNLE